MRIMTQSHRESFHYSPFNVFQLFLGGLACVLQKWFLWNEAQSRIDAYTSVLGTLSGGSERRRMVQKIAVSREFEARLRHAATGKLSLSTQQKLGTFFELGKDKAAKGEGWAPPFISCAQDTVEH